MLEWLRGYRTYKIWMGIVVVFLVSMTQSCSELKHSLWGKTTTAHISSVEPSSYRSGGYFLNFSFTDAQGAAQRVKRTVRTALGPFKQGETVEVIYLEGNPEQARLVSERSFVWPAIFFGMIGFAVLWTFVT